MCGDGNPVTAGFIAACQQAHEAVQPEAVAKMDTDVPCCCSRVRRIPVSNGGVAVRALEQLYVDAGIDVTSHYYPSARHEILNEINRDEVTADLRRWVDGVIGSASA